MKLTSKGRYAVTAMLDLALHTAEGPVTLAAISERQGISLSYLEQLFTRLRKHGLVSSTRGPGGGYSLSRSAFEIPVAAVVTAVDESVDATRCGGRLQPVSWSRPLPVSRPRTWRMVTIVPLPSRNSSARSPACSQMNMTE